MYEVDNILAYRVIDASKDYLEMLVNPIDVEISLDIKDDDKILTFKVDDVYQIREEDYLKCFGQEWVVKEVTKNGQLTSILAKHNIEKIKQTPVSSVYTETLTLQETLTAFFNALDTLDYGGNWTYELGTDILEDPVLLIRARTIDLRRVMAKDVIDSIANTWFLEVEYDTLNKIIKFYKQRGENKGTYFSSQLNLRKIELKSDTYDFITRLIPIGAEDLNISSVNDGSVVVENYQYSDKILTAYWVDNRYTIPLHLKQDAVLKLEDLSKPMKTYSCDIIDLSEDYPILSYGIGDTVTILDETLGIKDVQRIVKMTIYPYHPEDNKADLANRRATFDELQNQLVDTRNAVDQTYYSNGKIVFNEVTGLSTFKQTVETDIDSLSTTVTTLQEDIANIDASAYVIVLANESQSLQVDASNKLVANTYLGTKISTYLGSGRVNGYIQNVKIYSSSGNEISSMVVDYNENNITDTETGEFPSFYGSYEAIDGADVSIDGDYVKLSSELINSYYVIGADAETSTYWDEPELPFVAGQDITFSAYVKTGTYTLETAWQASTLYVVDSKVSYNGQNYKCVTEHTSTDFVEDADNWSLITYAYIQINEWTEESGEYTKTSYKSSAFQMNQEGLLVTNHTVSSNATNISLSIHCDAELAGTYEIWFKQCKLEEGLTSTTYTPLLDIPNNFEIKDPSETDDGYVEAILTAGTVIPTNIGYVSIPITVDGTTYFKRLSFSRVLSSETAPYINIVPTSQIMHSNDSGGTFTPNFVRLYPDIRNIDFIKWQYSYDGYVFMDVEYGEDTALLEDADGYLNTLYVSANSTLFIVVENEVSIPRNTLIFKLIADLAGTQYSDVITISKAYDYTETIETLDATVRVDIDSLNEQTTQFREDLYYYDEEQERYVPTTSDYSEFKQSVDNFMITVQDGGGANLLRDSVGYNYPDSGVWTVASGSVTSGVPSSWGLNYISKRSWYITSGVMYQDIVVQPATEYTFSCAINKEILGKITISYIFGSTEVIMFEKDGEAFSGTAKYTGNSGANSRFRIKIAVTPPGGSPPYPTVEITDVMVSLGKISSWQQSNGELFTSNVIIDSTGIKVKGADGNPSYTTISPYEFAGYYDEQRIFSLNGSKTEVQELVATGGGLYVAPVKLIQVSGTEPRAAFVWTGIQGD